MALGERAKTGTRTKKRERGGEKESFVLAPVFARSPTAILAFLRVVLDDFPEERRRLLAV